MQLMALADDLESNVPLFVFFFLALVAEYWSIPHMCYVS